MAEKKNTKETVHEQEVKTEQTSTETQEKAGTAKKTEAVYTVEEFAMNAQQLFKVRPECVRAAFKLAKVASCSKTEAENIVKAFMKKEVK